MAAIDSSERKEGAFNQKNLNDGVEKGPAKGQPAFAARPTGSPNALKRAWIKSKLSKGILIMMFKFSLPPTIALAVCQDTGAAQVYSTLAYLPAIISILSFAIIPRAKFIQTMLLNLIGTCIGVSIALLQIYCSVQARAHTTAKPPSGAEPTAAAATPPYNSSAAAVSAVWLFFNIYAVNVLRAARPQLQFPVIMYSIFANVTGVYAPSFPTMDAGISFVETIFEAFLTGFGIATAVSLLLPPVSVRMAWFAQCTQFLEAVQGCMKVQAGYFHALEREDAFHIRTSDDDTVETVGRTSRKKHTRKSKSEPKSPVEEEQQKLKAQLYALGELMGKMQGDLTFAKRELAFGKLNASEIDQLFKLLQGVLLPLMGLASTTDIFARLSKKWGWRDDRNVSEERKEVANMVKNQWKDILTTLHEPLTSAMNDVSDGLQHALYVLELAKPPKSKKNKKNRGQTKDIEADAGIKRPGDAGFADFLAERAEHVHDLRRSAVRELHNQRGITWSQKDDSPYPSKFDEPTDEDKILTADKERHLSFKGQIFLVLYVDYLLHSLALAALALVRFADDKVANGTMSRNRIISPTPKRLRKWLTTLLSKSDSTGSNENAPDSAEAGATITTSLTSSSTTLVERVELADENAQLANSKGKEKKDPEHLPPTTAWQRGSNIFRLVGQGLGSTSSAFGFRVACATMSVAIIAYLGDTRDFFLKQRLVWALIMVAIGMTVTAGSGVYGFIGRVAGTFVAMCTSLVIWYVVDGHAGGVIVVLWAFIFVEAYFMLVWPKLTVVALLSIVTQVLIIGYELEVQKVGVGVATGNGQPAYATSLLAPYRLATVVAGMFVAFFWTFFPYPLLARSQLRKDLGDSLFLLAHFYSIINTTISIRVRGAKEGQNLEGDTNDKQSSGRRLDKARRETYIHSLALLGGIRQHAEDTKWEPTFGGRFPREEYEAIIDQTQNILNYLALIGFASNTFSPKHTEHLDKWVTDFTTLLSGLDFTAQHRSTTSTLTLLSAAVANGTPLPPYLVAPPAYGLAKQVGTLQPALLGEGNVEEEGYAAFAVMQVASSLVADDLGRLIEGVKGLVGEVGFHFYGGDEKGKVE